MKAKRRVVTSSGRSLGAKRTPTVRRARPAVAPVQRHGVVTSSNGVPAAGPSTAPHGDDRDLPVDLTQQHLGA